MRKMFLLLMILLPGALLHAETGDASITGTGESYYGVRVNIPFGKKYDYSDILVTRVLDGATIKLADGAMEYKKMRDELDFRAFPDAWKKKEVEILTEIAKVIRHLEDTGNFLDAKRLKSAYGFDVAKRMAAKE